MTLGQVATHARFLTNTDTTSWTDAQLLIAINVWYAKIALMAIESGDDTDFDDARNSNYPIKTTPMVAGQRDYTIPVSEGVLKIKRVDLSYDGVAFYKAAPFDSGETPNGIAFDAASATDTTFDQGFSTTAPSYDVAYNSLFLFPMPTSSNMTNGVIRVEWERDVTLFTSSDYSSVITDSTVKPGFDEPLHPMLAYGAAFEYASAKNQPQLATISQELQDWEQRLRTHYGRKEWDRQLTVGVNYTNTYK